MNILKSIGSFILDLIKGIVGFILLIVIIFVVIVLLTSGWLYYQFGKNVAKYSHCVEQTAKTDLAKYISEQSFNINPNVQNVALVVDYDLVLGPIYKDLAKTELPDFIVKPFDVIGAVDNVIFTKIFKMQEPRDIVCIEPIDETHAKLFIGKDWYVWGSATIKTEQAPVGLSLQEIRLYTIKVPENYIEYLLGKDIDTSIFLDSSIKAVRKISFTEKGVKLDYNVTDLIIK